MTPTEQINLLRSALYNYMGNASQRNYEEAIAALAATSIAADPEAAPVADIQPAGILIGYVEPDDVQFLMQAMADSAKTSIKLRSFSSDASKATVPLYLATAPAQPEAKDEAPDLAKLRALAEAATPGPWEHDQPENMIGKANSNGTWMLIGQTRSVHVPKEQRDANGAYIAAANPATVLRLLDALAAPVPAVIPSEANGEAILYVRQMDIDKNFGTVIASPNADELWNVPLYTAPVPAAPADSDDDLFHPPKAMLKREDWDAATRKPKVQAAPADKLQAYADASQEIAERDDKGGLQSAASLDAASGSMEDFAAAADLVDLIRDAETNGCGLGAVLAYRRDLLEADRARQAVAIAEPVSVLIEIADMLEGYSEAYDSIACQSADGIGSVSPISVAIDIRNNMQGFVLKKIPDLRALAAKNGG